MSRTPSEPASPTSSSYNLPAGVSPMSSPEGLAAEQYTSRLNERMLTDLRDVRFRMARRSAAGYDVATVDEFVDHLEVKLRAGEPILDAIHLVRFPMAPRWGSGYEVGDIDAFLDQLENLAGEKGDALHLASVRVPDTRAPWLRASNPMLWLVGLAIVLVIVLYFM